MNRSDIEIIIEALEAGKAPQLTAKLIPAFSEESIAGNKYLSLDVLQDIANSLGKEDIPTFKRALKAIDEGDLAWLGFKVVYDSDQALQNTDNEVTKKYGDQGSADGEPLVFFCNDAKEIVSSREPSARDIFQMKDVTRGPSMHNEQFDGLTWVSVPLFDPVHVWLLGASDVAAELAPLLTHVGFSVTVVDYDPAYLNAERFPEVERILFEGDNFEELSQLTPLPADYVCVLTRGHMFDPEGCLWATSHHVAYVGMMGCAGKNNTVHDLVISRGMTEEQWDSIVRPIGLKFGAKTPAELAIAIAAQLIDVRYKQRYSSEAQERHEKSLGR